MLLPLLLTPFFNVVATTKQLLPLGVATDVSTGRIDVSMLPLSV